MSAEKLFHRLASEISQASVGDVLRVLRTAIDSLDIEAVKSFATDAANRTEVSEAVKKSGEGNNEPKHLLKITVDKCTWVWQHV